MLIENNRKRFLVHSIPKELSQYTSFRQSTIEIYSLSAKNIVYSDNYFRSFFVLEPWTRSNFEISSRDPRYRTDIRFPGTVVRGRRPFMPSLSFNVRGRPYRDNRFPLSHHRWLLFAHDCTILFFIHVVSTGLIFRVIFF